VVKEGGRIPFRNPEAPILVPRVGAVDPVNHPAQIFNRDAYTLRGKEMARDLYDASGRAQQREMMDDMRLTEGAEPAGLSQLLAIQMSPRFKNLADYEASPAGAATLTTTAKSKKWGSNFEALLADWAEMEGPDIKNRLLRDMMMGNSTPWVELLNQSAAKRNPFAQDLLAAGRTAPSEYAEIKTLGPLALTPEKIAGMLLPQRPVNDSGLPRVYSRMLADEMLKRKIPVVEYEGTDAKPPGIWKAIDALQQQAGPFGGSR
jgi:hypothetical protein